MLSVAVHTFQATVHNHRAAYCNCRCMYVCTMIVHYIHHHAKHDTDHVCAKHMRAAKNVLSTPAAGITARARASGTWAYGMPRGGGPPQRTCRASRAGALLHEVRQRLGEGHCCIEGCTAVGAASYSNFWCDAPVEDTGTGIGHMAGAVTAECSCRPPVGVVDNGGDVWGLMGEG